jgi:hypothetical protein
MDPSHIKPAEKKEAFKGGRGGGSASSGGLGASMLGNSGLMVHAGGITQCSSTDQSWFCWLSRLVGMIQYVFFLIVIVFMVYYFVWPIIAKKLGFSGSRKGKGRG